MGLNEKTDLHDHVKLQLHTDAASSYKFACTQGMCTQEHVRINFIDVIIFYNILSNIQ
jgi:hypothetical protein